MQDQTPPPALSMTAMTPGTAIASGLKNHTGASDLPYQSSIGSPQQPGSTSPSFHSPDPSSIFERNVQESNVPSEVSPAIPAHIKTEDMIPPALEASSLAITDNHLRPEEVEIVTHAAHQPAAATIGETASAPVSENHLPLSPADSQCGGFPAQHHESDESAPNYGTLDPNDVRRLSFISFADVVQAEQAEHAETESMHHVHFQSSTPQLHSRDMAGSSSPVRSPVTFTQPFAHGMTSPTLPGSGANSTNAAEVSPVRSPIGSPTIGAPHQHGELAIQTMSQALRKTASMDVGSASRTIPTSPVSPTIPADGAAGKATFK